ncbi:hypothetical protein BsWGS_08519 [Bradybaena similaris]
MIVYPLMYGMPYMYYVSPNTRIGLFQVCGVASGKCFDIADSRYYGMLSNSWRHSENLASTGLAFLLFGGILWQYLIAINHVKLLPVLLILVMVGNAFGIAGVVILFINGRYLFSPRFVVTPGWGLIMFIVACASGILSGCLLLVVSVAGIRNHRIQRSTQETAKLCNDVAANEKNPHLKHKM